MCHETRADCNLDLAVLTAPSGLMMCGLLILDKSHGLNWTVLGSFLFLAKVIPLHWSTM